jgi:hypothetical protein
MTEQTAAVPTEHYYRIGPACKYVGGVSEQLFRKLHREGKGFDQRRMGTKPCKPAPSSRRRVGTGHE